MKRGTLALLIAVAALPACGNRSDELPPPVTVEGEDTLTGAQTAVAALPDGAMSVGFAEIDNSGVRGDATIGATGDRTRIAVELVGAAGAGIHQGHVHRGLCDGQIGAIVVPLLPVATNAEGEGAVTSTVDVRMQDLQDGEHVIVYHEPGGNPGRPVTCAQIPELERLG